MSRVASVLLLASAFFSAAGSAQEPERAEPYFYTAFARQYVGRAAGIVEARVASVERIGVTTQTFVKLEHCAWMHPAQASERPPTLAVLGDLRRGLTKGSTYLFFLEREPVSSQLEIASTVNATSSSYTAKKEVAQAYLALALRPAKERFAAFLAFQEGALEKPGWSRWHALRELAEVALDLPARLEPAHFQRWRKTCEGDGEAQRTLDRVEKDWRSARERKAGGVPRDR